ncbi:carbohydrate ABC transporter permease [Auraticoccus monumenti]|uniref:Alpha-1,4-digalacturonate transport system permease protein n=1 Tax=Auraticoccus monumenti TaxID=675864 RepID=A0A1G7DCQ5_9ACTN|nr:sugar ABC transporter permease [Auraticoccus monumenti]SDE49384.1 alpha-1,4-digalacturonate transport system permease protein [Auraticoccus monumenti]
MTSVTDRVSLEAAPATVRRGGRRPQSGQRLAPALFISVSVVLFATFFVGPAALGIWYSLTDYSGVGDADFVGLENYGELLGDQQFWSSLGRTAVYTVLAVPLHFVAALFVAVLITSPAARGKGLAKIVLFVPWLISPIVTGVIWRWLFGENFGFVNHLLSLVGIGSVRWETDADWALVVVLLAGTWGGTAFNMLLFVAAIRNIPRSYLEAAEIDGASPRRRFFSVTLPLLAPTSFLVVLLGTLGSMKEFAMVQALNGGGPGTENMLIVQYIYRTGFERAEIGYASAVSMVLMAILVLVAVVQLRFDRKEDLS